MNLFSPPFTYNSRLKRSIYLINFVIDLVQVKGSKVHCLLQYTYLAVSYSSLEDLFFL